MILEASIVISAGTHMCSTTSPSNAVRIGMHAVHNHLLVMCNAMTTKTWTYAWSITEKPELGIDHH